MLSISIVTTVWVQSLARGTSTCCGQKKKKMSLGFSSDPAVKGLALSLLQHGLIAGPGTSACHMRSQEKKKKKKKLKIKLGKPL